MKGKILAAALIAGTAVASLGLAAAPAQAGVGIYFDPGIPPPGPGNCWVWSHYRHRWVWACSSPQYYPYYDAPGPIFGFGGHPYWGPDRYRHGHYPHGNYPHGNYPHGNYPKGNYPHGNYQQGNSLHGNYSKPNYPRNH